MRARTKSGADGCVSAAESETVKFCGTPDHPLNCNAPAVQGCLIGSTLRNDILPQDCREAQTTGCIRHLLDESQYAACLRAQPVVSHGCLIAGVTRRDIADTDCREAQQTGCIRRLLTQTQYTNCLAAQKK